MPRQKGCYNKPHTEEEKRKIGDRNRGKKLSEETKQKISVANKGKKRTEEVKQKLSIAHKGHLVWNKGLTKKTDERLRKLSEKTKNKHNSPQTEFRKGMISRNKGLAKELNPLYGRFQSEETKQKISNSHRGKKRKPFSDEWKQKIGLGVRKLWQNPEYREKMSKQFSGEGNPSWLGGKSFEPYGVKFNDILKNQIRARDEYKCVECGYSEEQLGYALSVHHIDYNKRNNNPNNLVSLCICCHTQTNFNRDDWTNYYQNMLELTASLIASKE